MIGRFQCNLPNHRSPNSSWSLYFARLSSRWSTKAVFPQYFPTSFTVSYLLPVLLFSSLPCSVTRVLEQRNTDMCSVEGLNNQDGENNALKCDSVKRCAKVWNALKCFTLFLHGPWRQKRHATVPWKKFSRDFSKKTFKSAPERKVSVSRFGFRMVLGCTGYEILKIKEMKTHLY